jgi:protein gp37
MTTGVEWVKNRDLSPGFALNPIDGCIESTPECDNCYARILAANFAQRFKTPRYMAVTSNDGRWNGDVFFHPQVLTQLQQRRKPATYFVGDMADVATPGKVEDAWLSQIWQAFWECRDRHTLLVLTKHPHRLLKFLKSVHDHPTQAVWIGTTIGHPISTKRLPAIKVIAELGYNTFISAEPLLHEIDYQLDSVGVRWLILGGESKPKPKTPVRPCLLEWMESAINQCRTNNVSVFVKQLGTIPMTNRNYRQTRSLSREEFETLESRLESQKIKLDHSWLTPETRMFLTSHKKGGGEDMTEFPKWAQIRELPYLVA